MRRIPRSPFPLLLQVGLDWVSQDAEPSAAVLGGILYGRVAPGHEERCTFQAPTLIIGHPNDPVHPFSDAGMLASELPNGRLLHASSILELRLAPKRLTAEIAAFVDECWTAPARRRPARHAAPAQQRPDAPRRGRLTARALELVQALGLVHGRLARALALDQVLRLVR